jgi:hypothetical protein
MLLTAAVLCGLLLGRSARVDELLHRAPAIVPLRGRVAPHGSPTRPSLAGKDLHGADLHGAHLAHTNLSSADLRGARYDRTTLWRSGFDPQAHGAIQVTTEPQAAPTPLPSAAPDGLSGPTAGRRP